MENLVQAARNVEADLDAGEISAGQSQAVADD